MTTPVVPIVPADPECEPPRLVRTDYKFILADDLIAERCKYIMVRGSKRGEQCSKNAVIGEHFCPGCLHKKVALSQDLPKLRLPVGRPVRLATVNVMAEMVEDESDSEDEDVERVVELFTIMKDAGMDPERLIERVGPAETEFLGLVGINRGGPDVLPGVLHVPRPQDDRFCVPQFRNVDGRGPTLRELLDRALAGSKEPKPKKFICVEFEQDPVPVPEQKNLPCPDLTLMSSDGVARKVHKATLTAVNPYFKRYFAEHPDLEHVLVETSATALQLYLDLFYGETVTLPNWRVAFEVLDYFDATNIYWYKDDILCAFDVAPDDYNEYVGQLERVCAPCVPRRIVAKAQRFRNTGATSSNPDIPVLPRANQQPARLTVVPFGNVHGHYRALALNVVLTVDAQCDTKCIGYVTDEMVKNERLTMADVLPLTPELKTWCKEQGIAYESSDA